MPVSITITELPGDKPLYRVGMVGSDGKTLLSRRFRERHIAIGMAIAVCGELGLPVDLMMLTGNAGDDGDDGDDGDE